MSEPYVGECRLVGFNFAPVGWAECAGQLVAISSNETLFTLIGTTYGGDGQQTFALPDLRGRVPVHQGTNQGNTFIEGQLGGVEEVTLITQQMPSHNHSLNASANNGNSNLVQNQVLAASPTQIYVATNPLPNKAMNAAAITHNGINQPHTNLQPYLAMNWIIALFGIFPTQN